MLKLADNLEFPLDAVTQKFGFLGRSGSGKTYGAGKMSEEMLRNGAQVVILDPIGNWSGLRLAADGKDQGFPIPVFGGEHGDVPLDYGSGQLVADLVVDKGISVVLDVHLFRKHQRKEFMTSFAEHLFHRQKSKRSPLHVVIEEAQLFIPQKAFRGDERLLGAMEDLCKIGRNYGIGYTLITQRPQAVNKDVLNQTGTLFVFNMTGPQERKVMQGWIVEQAVDITRMVDDLPRLPEGICYLWSPQWLERFEKIKVAKKRTFDASATPTSVGKHSERPMPELSGAELEEIQQSMKDTIKRAKANDPKELKRRIAELERQLRNGGNHNACGERIQSLTSQLETVSSRMLFVQSQFHEFRVRTENTLSEFDTLLEPTFKLDELPKSSQIVPTPAHQPGPSIRQTSRSSHGASGASHSDLPAGARRLLGALAQWFPRGRNEGTMRSQAGMKKSGTYTTYLSALRTRGFIEKREGLFFATQAGVDYLGVDAPPAPTTTQEVLDIWAPRLPQGARRMLDILIDLRGETISRSDLANRAGFAESGTFSTYLSQLQTAGLIKRLPGGTAADVEALLL